MYSHERTVILPWRAIDTSGLVHTWKKSRHVERRKQARDTWSFEESGNFIADIVAGPDYQDKLAQEGLKPVTLCIPAVELLQQLVPKDVWNIYAPYMNPVPWTHAAEVWEMKDHQAYMKKRSEHCCHRERQRLDQGEYVPSQQTLEDKDKVSGGKDNN